jgi:choline dehydrogenase-like flavoprotein
VILPLTHAARVKSVDALRARLAHGIDRRELELFTVHLMGTARIGSDPASSVVNPNGELWDLPGCYVADASAFPTAIGVNPQVTIMALATRLASRFGSKRAAA